MKRNSAVVIEGVTISNPSKNMFAGAGITKQEVANYYVQAAPLLLLYAKERILSIVRCPHGIASSCFYKKHPGPPMLGILKTSVTSSDGSEADYFYVETASGLVSEAQMGTIEFHLWGSKVHLLEHPDTMVFDLDPDEELDISQIRQGVRDLKTMLDSLSLDSFLKTSGNKGYHVVVPFTPAASWDVFHDFARHVAQALEEQWPNRYTSNSRKVQRRGRIFVDWLRNGRGATSISPYSLRAREQVSVSMPISWSELDTVGPADITLKIALKKMRKTNPWQNYFEVKQELK